MSDERRPTFLQTLMAVLDPSRGTVNALRARLAEAEADLDREKRAHGLTQVDAARFAGRADRAEARAETAEAERDRLREAGKVVMDDAYRSKCIYEASQARVDTLTEALLVTVDPANRDYPGRWLAAARAALAAVKGREGDRADAGFRDRHGRAIDSSQGGPVEGREDMEGVTIENWLPDTEGRDDV